MIHFPHYAADYALVCGYALVVAFAIYLAAAEIRYLRPRITREKMPHSKT